MAVWIVRPRVCLGLSRIEGELRTPEIGLAKLVGNIRKVLHHPALTLQRLPPFSVLLLPALEKRGRAIDTHPARPLLTGSVGSRRPVLGVDVLRVHLRMNGKAGAREGKPNSNPGEVDQM